ncbi:MAG: PQQ-dependent sugar dehydrogenase [Spirosomataceae bacterium]|jgi:glucose/arabinose dehydrogenase
MKKYLSQFRVVVPTLLLISLVGYKYRQKVEDYYTIAEWKVYKKVSESLQEPISEYRTVRVFPALAFEQPTTIKFFSLLPNKVFVSEKKGELFAFDNDDYVKSRSSVLKIKNVRNIHFTGFLDFELARHTNGATYLYVFYNTSEGDRKFSNITRFLFNEKRLIAIEESEKLLLKIPSTHHQGGCLLLDKNNNLHISVGDGMFGDPDNNAQNLGKYNGKILKINVGGNSLYEIPDDNPFVDKMGIKPEIYAYGFRNPFRMSIDSKTESLWVADVGHYAIEEINIVQKGGNYGWNYMEGNKPFRGVIDSIKTSFIKPIYTYKHGLEGFSVTGGFVYRGTALQSLQNKYIYGDYVRGVVWALDYSKKPIRNILIAEEAGNISSFALSSDEGIYYTDFVNGTIHQIVLSNEANL